MQIRSGTPNLHKKTVLNYNFCDITLANKVTTMNYVSRTMEKTIEKFIGKYPVIMVTGPIQVGKTTLLNYLKFKSNKKINYVTLDDMLIRTQANEDPELFLRTHEAPLIIDEFQYAPNLLTYIKIIIDEARQNEIFNNKEEAGTMYYLTGSRVFETMKDVSESLAGRVGIFDLFAFSDRELYKMEEPIFNPQIDIIRKVEPTKRLSTNQIFERIIKGSYPDVQAGREVSIENYYSNYIRTYIERDIRQLINIKNEIKFTKFISAVAARTGQEFNASKIGTEIGIDGKTADDWISILKNTGIIYLLQSYTNNNATRAVRTQKVYFMDTGLACYLTGYTDNEVLEKSSYSGAIFETYIISEIIKSYSNNGIDSKRYLYFYRDSNQKEIDLLIINNNTVYPVEIKKSSNPGISAIKNFNVVDKFNMNNGNGIVLCLCREINALDNNNYLVPIEYI